MHGATLEYDFSAVSRARIVERSVRQEVGEIADDRSGATVDREGATVVVEVDAGDLVGLRAALNTWQGLVGVAEETAEAAAAAAE